MKSNSLLNPDWIWVFLVEWVPFMNHSEKKQKKRERGGERGRRRDKYPCSYYNGPLVEVR